MSLNHLSPEQRVLLAGVAPLRTPRTGAEALLLTSMPDDARRILTRALARLSRLHEELLQLAEHLTAQLDRIDGDPDLEPHLGAPETFRGNWSDIGEPGDREEEADEEPSLGSMSNRMDQRRWALGAGDDAEDEHDGRETRGWSVKDERGRPADQRFLTLTLGAENEREEACEGGGDGDEDSGLCAWTSGDVDQRVLPEPFGLRSAYVDEG